jgi:SAM-dependent methyltransferase
MFTDLLPARADPDAATQFLQILRGWLDAGSFVRLVLSRHEGEPADLQRLTVRPVVLAGQPQLGFLFHHATRDITKNHPPAQGLELVASLLGSSFKHAHLHSLQEEVQLRVSRKGKATLLRGKAALRAEASTAHDRQKERIVDPTRPFLAALGVTDAQGQLIPAMARKWRQINKFVEVFSHAYAGSPLAGRDAPVRVLDFGSGKGYLTFAVHDHLQRTLGRETRVTGVELREDMVALCNGVVARLGLQGLHFEAGDVGSHARDPVDVMIALHACDTATDHALHHGIRAGAAIILSSPCCHKQIRPQMHSPALLAPMLQHGIHLGQQAEMVTDSLRALLLEAHGYATQVFEFVSLEHTSKNKMILAVKRASGAPSTDALQQVRAIKEFYGVREHCLETLLAEDAASV